MIINIQATGNLKQYIPTSNKVELPDGATIKVLKSALNIGDTVKLGFNHNGKMAKEDQSLKDNDSIILIMFVSAG